MDIDHKNVRLDFPSLKLIPSYAEALREGFYRGIQPQKSEDEIIQIEQKPSAYIESLNKQGGSITLDNGDLVPKVPYENLWLSSDDIFIGEVSLRLQLSDYLKKHGGHVGYGIRPSLQNKGLGTLALSLTKKRAVDKGIHKLLLTCSPDNIASKKIITKNGGVHQDTIDDDSDSESVERYWIDLKAP
jgi:predicted acetyltransferase